MVLILPCKSLQKTTRERRRIKEEALYPNKRPRIFLWQGQRLYKERIKSLFYGLIEIIWGKERIMEVYLNSIRKWEMKHYYGPEATDREH
jgi:monofunctional biosynthetic peptidoglycan transglycosylase